MAKINFDNEYVYVRVYFEGGWTDSGDYVEPIDLTINYDEQDIITFPDGVDYSITVYVIDGYKLTSVSGYIGIDYLEFDISEDGKTSTFTANLWHTNELYIETEIDETGGSDDISGFNHLYLVDKTILSDISKERFRSGSEMNVIDLGQYIINVLELPFSIGADIQSLENYIILGNSKLNITAIELLNDEMKLDLGEIYIPKKYHSSYDFLNTNVFLHLPFTHTIELNVNYCIGETIGILYIIDLYTGNTTINITSSKLNGGNIHTEQINLGKNIPFIRNGGDVINELITSNGVNNQLYQPFIEVIRNRPYQPDNPFNEGNTVVTKLKNEVGHVRVVNGIIETSANLNEKNKIMNLLRNGVYIK